MPMYYRGLVLVYTLQQKKLGDLAGLALSAGDLESTATKATPNVSY